MNIRLSSFGKYILFGITFIVLLSINLMFNVDINDFENFLFYFIIWVTRITFAIVLFYWSIEFTYELRDVVVFKYKYIKKSKYRIELKYLTFFWLFIPYWKSVEENYHSYETQNIFGAKNEISYSISKSYSNDNELNKALKLHKEKIKRNKKRFFEIPEKSEKYVKYL